MHLFAYYLLHIIFLFYIGAAGCALLATRSQESSGLRLLAGTEKLLLFNILLLTIGCGILFYAFAVCDFTFKYVHDYSDRTLPLFYRLTAFWAGQPGSLLFWGWAVALSGLLFSRFSVYMELTASTKQWHWGIFSLIMAFFLLLLIVWSNPFIVLSPTPIDGFGLNPLLQNPGMIIHPPILFLGYGGFVIPCCLALAQAINGQLVRIDLGTELERHWSESSRPFVLISWSLLSGGIILGAWWAYMELGWGGYWAWDPVENASLIPWLVATAYLHTGVIETRRNKLGKTNVFLITLTTVSTFFATYLVRSGVIKSLHAFSKDSVGNPLLVFTLVFLLFAIIISALSKDNDEPLEGLSSREGLLIMITWLLLSIAMVILIATMWPVIGTPIKTMLQLFFKSIKTVSDSEGLNVAFYNLFCLPLFGLISFMLVVCPFRRWKTNGFNPLYAVVAIALIFIGLFKTMKFLDAEYALVVSFSLSFLLCALIDMLFWPQNWRNRKIFILVLVLSAVLSCGAYLLGITNPLAAMVTACSLAAGIGLVLLSIYDPSFRQLKTTLAAHGTHLGVLIIAAGIALSGGYTEKYDLLMDANNRTAIVHSFAIHSSPLSQHTDQQRENGNFSQKLLSWFPLSNTYTIQLQGLFQGQANPEHYNYSFVNARLEVFKNGRYIGMLIPERRQYIKFEGQSFTEVDTLFSVGDEIYATLGHIDAQGRAHINISITPLVNWLWLGGIVLCIFPLWGLGKTARQKEQEENNAATSGSRNA